MLRFSHVTLAISLTAAACGTSATTTNVGTTEPADAAVTDVAPIDAFAEASLVDKGKHFVEVRGCADCHQSNNPADGVLSGQMTPQPGTHAYGPNLTPDQDTGIGGWTDAEIVRAMRDGLDDQASPLCPPMPKFADMNDDEAAAIVAYLRSLPPVPHQVPDSACSDGG